MADNAPRVLDIKARLDAAGVISGSKQARKALTQMKGDAEKTGKSLSGTGAQAGKAEGLISRYGKKGSSSLRSLATSIATVEGPLGAHAGRINSIASLMDQASAATGRKEKSVKSLSKALLLSGIGAFVIILGTLIQAFRSTQEGADRFNRAWQPIKATFQTMWGLAQQLALAIGDRLTAAFKDPKQAVKDLGDFLLQNIINRFKAAIDLGGALGRGIQSLIKLDLKGLKEAGLDAGDAILQLGTGAEDAGSRIANLGRDIAETSRQGYEAGQRLQELNEQIENLRVQQEVPLSRLRREYEELRNVARDTTLAEQERLDAADKAIGIRQKIRDEELKLLDLEIERMALQHSLNDTSREEQLEYQKLLAQREEIASAAERELGRVYSQRNTAINQIETQRQAEAKAAEEAVQAQQQRADQYRDLLLTEEELAQKKFDAELVGLRELLNQELITRQEFLAIRNELENQYLNSQQEELAARAGSIIAIEEELATARLAYRRAVDDEERALHAEEMERIQERLDAITSSEEQTGEIRDKSLKDSININEQYGTSVKENVSGAIDAYLSEAVMLQVRNVLASVPFPFNIVALPAATAAVKGLVSSVVPKFQEGGMTTPGMKLISINEDQRPEYIVNAESTRRALPVLHRINSDPGFADMINRAITGGGLLAGGTTRPTGSDLPLSPSSGINTQLIAEAVTRGMERARLYPEVSIRRLDEAQTERDRFKSRIGI